MNASMSQNPTGAVGGNAHSFVCCDMDHGSSSRPRSTSPCPFEAYCCLDQHCASPAPCDDSCEPCPEKCSEPCPEACAEPCKDNCTKECQPCDDPQCPEPAAAWCPTTCTIEEYIQRCTDTACTLPQVELDPLALLAQQPLNQNYFDLVAQVFGTQTGGPQVTPQAMAPAAVAAPLPLTHVCHWQNCHRSFDSMPILLAHIAADHLSAPGYDSSPAPLTSAAVTPQAQTHQQPALAPSRAPSLDSFGGLTSQPQGGHSDVFSCLWDDCFPFGVGAGTGTNTSGQATPHAHTQVQGMHDHSHADHGHSHGHGQGLGPTHPAHNHGVLSPQTMLRHLLEDHLGVADVLQANADAHAHLVLTHTHANQHQHHQAPQHPHVHGHVHAHAPHDAHAHASTHAALGPHHHHPVAPMKLPPTPSPTPPGSSTTHVCLWPGCTAREPFLSAGELMEHLSEVHIGRGRDSYRCRWDGCGGAEGRLFSSRQKVLRHLQSHTGHRPYVCSVCGQTFSEAAPLAAHMRRHADDKPFVCDHPGCGKAFAISSSLTIHKRTHNGDRPFVCPHCSKGFVEASNLTKHIRTHTGERPFACSHPGCGRRFSRPDQLKRHALVHDAAHKGRLAAKAKA